MAEIGKIKPEKYRVEKPNGETKILDEFTYVPSHEREEIEPYFTSSDLFTVLDEIETALLEGGASEAFEKIEDLEEEIREIAGPTGANSAPTKGESQE